MKDEAELVPIDEAAALMKICVEDLTERVRAGDPPGVYAPDAGGWFIRRDDIRRTTEPGKR